MKRIFILAIALLLACAWGWGAEPEKEKRLVSPRGTYKITVPEKAPDFLGAEWKEEIIAAEELPNGDFWAVRADVKENMTVMSFAYVRKKEPNGHDYYLLAFAVSYDGPLCTQWYFDEEYIKTGEPSGRFAGPVDPETGREKMEKIISRVVGASGLKI